MVGYYRLTGPGAFETKRRLPVFFRRPVNGRLIGHPFPHNEPAGRPPRAVQKCGRVFNLVDETRRTFRLLIAGRFLFAEAESRDKTQRRRIDGKHAAPCNIKLVASQTIGPARDAVKLRRIKYLNVRGPAVHRVRNASRRPAYRMSKIRDGNDASVKRLV